MIMYYYIIQYKKEENYSKMNNFLLIGARGPVRTDAGFPLAYKASAIGQLCDSSMLNWTRVRESNDRQSKFMRLAWAPAHPQHKGLALYTFYYHHNMLRNKHRLSLKIGSTIYVCQVTSIFPKDI